MAALIAPSGPIRADSVRKPDDAAMTAAMAYVGRCLRGHRPFAIITGSRDSGVHSLAACIEADYRGRDELHVIRLDEPRESVQAFLAACLTQLGFDLFEAGLDDLHNLLVVFLRHESARGRRTVILIHNAERSGPRVLEFLHTLARVRAGPTPALSIVMTGSRSLHRVLDSPGMAAMKGMTRERFDLDRAFAWVSPAADIRAVADRVQPGNSRVPSTTSKAVTGHRLVVTLDGAVIEQRSLNPGRLIIGRSRRSDLCLDSRYVSRNHAALLVSGEDATIIDLGSTNGTLVDGSEVSDWILPSGAIIGIGNFRLRYSSCQG